MAGLGMLGGGLAPSNSLADIWRAQRAAIPVVKDATGVHLSYQKDPVRWMVEQMQVPEHTIRWSKNPGYDKHQWDGTKEPLVAALQALADWENLGVEAGTGTQKTYVLGALAKLWFLGCFENSLVVTLAPKESQLKLLLWKESRRLWPRFQTLFPQARLTDLKLRMRGGLDEAWTATGFTAGVGADEETANKARGFHAEHALFIFEEAPGVDTAVSSAIDFTCTAPHNLQLKYGNPDSEQDALHQYCQEPGVQHIIISALDHPNVVVNRHERPKATFVDFKRDRMIVPGAASRFSVERLKRKHGEGSDSYNAKVRGIAPKQSADSLIRWEWCEAAAARGADAALRVGHQSMGIDVADSPEGDQYAIARGIGACVVELVAAQIGKGAGPKDAQELGEEVGLEMQLEGIDELYVGVDSVGVGASTVNALKKVGFRVQALNGGGKPRPELDQDTLRETGKGIAKEELYDNLRSQIYYQLRMDLQHNRIAFALPPEVLVRLFRDLTAAKWERRLGKISVEPKETPKRGGKENKNWGLKGRLGRSPNEGDAVAYWNFVRPRRALVDTTPQASAFSEEQLAHDAIASRRMKPAKPADRKLPAHITEHVD